MQAIILAAGMGKRLGALTRNNTKCMIQVNGVTLIERMMRQLDRLSPSLEKIVIVTGYEGEKLKTFLSRLDISTPVEYVDNPLYASTNNIYSLYLAKEHLLQDDTLLFESDLIFEDSVIDALLRHPYPSLALVAKFESWMDGTVVTLDEDDNIVELGLHSPYYDSPPAGCRTMGEQHMFHDWMAHPENAPDNWNPVTKALDD